MAMRVVTLDNLKSFIEDTSKSSVNIAKKQSSVVFIGSETNDTMCSIPNTGISNLSDEIPFLKFRDQVSGVLKVNGRIVSDEEIKPYSFLLD